jgi:putative Mn2+ efflux pump MntP
MGLDIKLPIGLMFSIFGVILTILGIASAGDTELYAKSLGININLWSGLFMLLFGGWMLYLALRKKNKAEGEE